MKVLLELFALADPPSTERRGFQCPHLAWPLLSLIHYSQPGGSGNMPSWWQSFSVQQSCAGFWLSLKACLLTHNPHSWGGGVDLLELVSRPPACMYDWPAATWDGLSKGPLCEPLEGGVFQCPVPTSWQCAAALVLSCSLDSPEAPPPGWRQAAFFLLGFTKLFSVSHASISSLQGIRHFGGAASHSVWIPLKVIPKMVVFRIIP